MLTRSHTSWPPGVERNVHEGFPSEKGAVLTQVDGIRSTPTVSGKMGRQEPWHAEVDLLAELKAWHLSASSVALLQCDTA